MTILSGMLGIYLIYAVKQNRDVHNKIINLTEQNWYLTSKNNQLHDMLKQKNNLHLVPHARS